MAEELTRRAEQANDTRAALVRAARALFTQKGFHGTGTTEIAASAGVTRGALQHHFPRKEDLFLAVFEQVQEDMVKVSSPQALDRHGETWLQLKSDLIRFLDAATEPEVQRIILIDGPAVLGWAEWRRLEAHFGLGVIERGVLDGINAGLIRRQEALPLAHMILSIIDEAALMIANASDPSHARRNATLALDTLLSSLD
ncbi:MAG: TetR/AcrR family transcriptional regulator [Sphingobium sp.]